MEFCKGLSFFKKARKSAKKQVIGFTITCCHRMIGCLFGLLMGFAEVTLSRFSHWLPVAMVCVSAHAFALDIGDEDLKKKGYAGEAEAGVNLTTGNTETTTWKGRLAMDFFLEHWRHNTEFKANYAKDDGDVSAERYFASYKANRDWSDSRYTFGLIKYEDDRFNGLENTITAAIGYGARVVDTNTQYLDIEGGPGWRSNAADDADNEVILRFAADYDWKLSGNATFHQTFSTEIGSDNTISRAETSINTTVIGALAMKASFSMTHQTEPADNDNGSSRKNLDTITALTLLYSF